MKKFFTIIIVVFAFVGIINFINRNNNRIPDVSYIECGSCDGTGVCKQCNEIGKCNICEGVGSTTHYYTGFGEITRECSLCHGSGNCILCKGSGECRFCNGTGHKEYNDLKNNSGAISNATSVSQFSRATANDNEMTYTCIKCNGNGIIKCIVCKGTGKNLLYEDLHGVLKAMSKSYCEGCDGKGYITCGRCHGSGVN